MNILGRGCIEKMLVSNTNPVGYVLPMGDGRVVMNELLGQTVQLQWTGNIACINCQRPTTKSFNQGYCYPCFTRLAVCDMCVVKPELCHYHKGTCREPGWGEKHCLIAHTVYLANSSGLKVGITRGLDATTRWIDQGAAQAIAIRTVPTRLDAGKVEVAFKAYTADKTDWRKMLKGDPEPVDMVAERDRLLTEVSAAASPPGLPGEPPMDSEVTQLKYPVLEFPLKVVSHNLDKKPLLEGTLQGIKGQYLMLDVGVINMRKYGGYELVLSA